MRYLIERGMYRDRERRLNIIIEIARDHRRLLLLRCWRLAEAAEAVEAAEAAELRRMAARERCV